MSEPQWTGSVIYASDTSSQALERQTAYTKARASVSVYLTGIGKTKAKNIVKGKHSPVRFLKKQSLHFVVRVADNTMNPQSIIKVFPLEVGSNGTRYVNTGSAGTFSGIKAGDIDYVSYSAKKYMTSSYLITIDSLTPGEYGLVIQGSPMEYNLFGVGEISEVPESSMDKDQIKLMGRGLVQLGAGQLQLNGVYGGAQFFISNTVSIGGFGQIGKYYTYGGKLNYKVFTPTINYYLYTTDKTRFYLGGGYAIGKAQGTIEPYFGVKSYEEIDLSDYEVHAGFHQSFGTERLFLMGELGYGLSTIRAGLVLHL